MPSKTVLCEYCQKRINKNPVHRKNHRQSKAHLENVQAYFNSYSGRSSVGIGPWERVYTDEEKLYYDTMRDIVWNDLYMFQTHQKITNFISES